MENSWTRRRFLGSVVATGALSAVRPGELSDAHAQEALPPPRSQANSPEITAGGVVPLTEENVARPLRYTPESGGFSIHNGKEFFNRPLYGPNIPFRVDGGDLPEFSLYLPGHGGNLRLGLLTQDGRESKWLQDCESVAMRWIDGRLHYEIRDAVLGADGKLELEALAAGAALWVQLTASNVSRGVELVWAFGGVSGRKGKRNGDIGCEDEPVSQFFQLRPEECRGNRWTLSDGVKQSSAEVQADKMRISVACSLTTQWALGEADQWNNGWSAMWQGAKKEPELPVLLGRTRVQDEPIYLSVTVLAGAVLPSKQDQRMSAASQSFNVRRSELTAVARRVQWKTPDPFFNSMAGALGIASDAIWDEAQGCVMHGGVAWRIALAGWRGPYCLDALGDHERMRRHVRHWIARQNTTSVMNGSSGEPTEKGFAGVEEAKGAPDPGSHLARTENLLHSSGDLSHNHYDMNLVFFDAVLRHLRWTGDAGFAREVWPALQLHAAWERRLFRRLYGDKKDLPLYEAYAAIWASDNLQYNGGGAAHSSAYNVFLNRGMAELAKKLGEPAAVAAAYNAEADAIVRAMQDQLWMKDRGAFAESREWLGEQCLAEDPAVWTVYHTIDSEVVQQRVAWQMLAERLRALRKVPVRGPAVPADAGWQLACSDWQPYVWSLTLLVLAENLHTALAMFQAGMAEEGWMLLRGSLLDAGFRSLCPGNFPMSLQLDPHRQESQRDFGDPVGCASRAIVEGLWGVRPDVMNDVLRLRPMLPLEWESGEFGHPDVALAYERRGLQETWTITPRFAHQVTLLLELRARSMETPRVVVNGIQLAVEFDRDAVGEPRLRLPELPAAASWTIAIEWEGELPARGNQADIKCVAGKRVQWPTGVQATVIDDPQECLRDGAPHHTGRFTVFLRQERSSCAYWLPVELEVVEPLREMRELSDGRAGRFESVPLDEIFTGNVRGILTRPYSAPRPSLCSLNLPDGLLGGWANFDVKAHIDDAGWRGPGVGVRLDNGVEFLKPASFKGGNCCFISQWQLDKPRVIKSLRGRARMVHLLLAGTTFPQATRSCHGEVVIHYAAGKPDRVELRSPNTWWPVEQDYMLDDYIFRLDPEQNAAAGVEWRVDLLSGRARKLDKVSHSPGGVIKGGSAFVVSIKVDPQRNLQAIELHTRLYGIVLAWMGLTLERA